MRLRISLSLLGVLPLALLTGCDETPTGRSQLALVPEHLMAEMGADTFNQLRRDQPGALAFTPAC